MILHLANDYAGSTVYKNLTLNLDNLGVSQMVYVPLRNPLLKDKNRVTFKSPESKILYRPILSFYTRIDHKAKKNRILKDINDKVDITPITFIHAHTWYSDGAIALDLYKKHGVPYIVTVRNTDLNLFYKYMIHLRALGMEILKEAEQIILISPRSKLRMSLILKNSSRSGLISKLMVIQNGVDPFWIKNWTGKKELINSPVELIYIGGFNKNKNVDSILNAYKILKYEGIDLRLNLVGDSTNSRLKQINKDDENIVFHGFLKNKNKVSDLLRKSDIFVMPSHSETFGLVYVEALSQGVPVVYTKGEGIDGFYDSSIGESVDSNNLESITNGIRKIILNYALYNFNSKKIAENHDWNTISKQYLNIYESVSSK